MPAVDHVFRFPGTLGEAQTQFVNDLLPGFKERGFKLRDEQPGHLDFGVAYATGSPFWWLLWGLWTAPYWLARIAAGRRLEVDFASDGERTTTIEIYGRAGRSMHDALRLLGHNGHWPETLCDPDWYAGSDEPGPDPLAVWDDIEIDPATLDPITRRALKKAGRL